MATAMTIGRAAERAGVGIETIRFYERRGLIAQPRRPLGGGYRFYDDAIVERIRFIRQAQELGFSLREIGDLLSLRAHPAADCADVRVKAVAKRAEVDRRIAQLQRIQAALDELIAACPGGGALRACSILEAMAGRADEKRKGPKTVSRARRSEGLGNKPETGKGLSMRTTVFTIEGMHCEGCARTIQALVTAQAGVQAATVSFETREARILYDPRALGEDRLATVIKQAGYSAAQKS